MTSAIGAMKARELACAVVGFILLGACGRPVIYPRSAEITEGLSVRVRSNVSHGDATVHFAAPEGYVPAPGEPSAGEIESAEYSGHASSATHSYDHVFRVLGFFFSVEGELGYAPVDGIELNGWLGLQATGFELRAQPLAERNGAPFSLALSAGGLTPSLIGTDGIGLRFGVDLSRHIGKVQIFLGGYGSWGPRQRNMKDDDFPDDGEGHIYPGELIGVVAVRNEWKLSVPMGVQFGSGGRAGVVLGLVPEFTLSADLTSLRCKKICGGFRPSSFEQTFALYFTVGGDFGVYRP